VIIRCNRYEPGVAPTRSFTCVRTCWMVNAKPEVSVAWPPRSPDHNALVLFFPGGPQPWRTPPSAPSSSVLPPPPLPPFPPPPLADRPSSWCFPVKGTRPCERIVPFRRCPLLVTAFLAPPLAVQRCVTRSVTRGTVRDFFLEASSKGV